MEIKSVINHPNKLVYLIVAHLLILLGYSVNHGIFFHPAQLWLLSLGWLVLFLLLFKKNWLIFKFSKPLNLLLAANFVSFILFYFFDGGIYLISKSAFDHLMFLKLVALFLFFLYLVDFNFKGKNFFSYVILHLAKHKFFYLVLLALILRLLIVFYSPNPIIDVMWASDGGVKALLSFSNPYSQEFFNGYTPKDCLNFYGNSDCKIDKYPYFPACLLLAAVFKIIFGDLRFTYIFAVFGCAGIIYFLLKEKFPKQPLVPQLVSLLILYLPLGLFVLEQGWVDSLSVFLLYLFIFLILKEFRFLPYLVFGIFLATKQIMLIFLPFLFKLKAKEFKKLIFSLVVFLAIILPFTFWSYQDFVSDVFIHQFEYEGGSHSLSFSTLNKFYFSDHLPYLFLAAILLIVLFLFLLVKMRKNLTGFIEAALVFLLAIFLLRRGFANYYDSVSAIIILLIALELQQNNYQFID